MVVCSTKKSCIILGGGGHAQVLIDCIQLKRTIHPHGIIDQNSSLWGKELLGVPIIGGDRLLSDIKNKGVVYFIVGVGGIGDNRPRKRLFELGLSHGLKPITIIHPSAICSQWSIIEEGTVIFPGAIINAGARVGTNVIINSGAIVEHNCVIQDHVHLATGVKLSGAVYVGAETHIGAGATIRQNVSIGERSIVGAGSVVVKNIPANTIVKGVPAR